MLDKHCFEAINAEDFKALLDSYKDVVPEDVSALEEQRLAIIPRAISERETEYLTKAEVQTLVDWKLNGKNLTSDTSSHGKFRPSLKKLVASNSEQAVEESTKAAFALYAEDDESWDQAVAKLAKELRGVGPATASLLLSTYDVDKVPFFSDELFRWAMWEKGKGRGWDRKLKYSIGEYKQLFRLVKALTERLGKGKGSQNIKALDAEMVAYVLGKREGAERVQAGKKREPTESEAVSTEADVAEAKAEACTRGSSDGAKRRWKRMRFPVSEEFR